MKWKLGQYLISTDQEKLNIPLIHGFLSVHSYWAKGIPLETVQRSIRHSMCFGLYRNEEQIGFARVISDRATYAYLGDVFVLPEERGKGMSKWLIQVIVEHPELQGLRRFVLATRDAHGLYAQFGFAPYAQPENIMNRHNSDVYTKKTF